MDRRIGTSVMSSNGKGAAPVCCGEEGAELDGEAFSLLVHLCSKPPPMVTDLGSDPKNEVVDTCG